jgi:N-methylhydantoinase A/oxoprolinase/acetone carboxylase beta subunit
MGLFAKFLEKLQAAPDGDGSILDHSLIFYGGGMGNPNGHLSDPLPVVAVGGGSILLPDDLPGSLAVHRPDHFAVANAIGAAIAQVGGEVDRVYAIDPGRRDAVVDEARQEAVDRAIAAGADPAAVRIVDFDEVPIPYLPGNATRIRCKAVGDLRLGEAS